MQNLNVVKSYLKRELNKVIKGIEIGNAYSFKGNAVVVIPMQLNGWWYGRSEEHTSELQSLV